MTEAIAAVLPFVAAGAFLPTWTVYVILLLGTRRPLANALGFVGGNAVFRLGLGLFVLYVLGTIPGIPQASDTPTRGAAIGYGVGAAVVLVLGVLSLRKPDDPERPEPGWMRRFERMSPAVSFGLGLAAVASPGIQWVYFLGGMNEIVARTAGAGSELVLLALFVFALQLMLLAPVAVYVAAPARASATLGAMKYWINGHTNRLSGVILLLVAVYLATRAWSGLA
jgi:hypothetical protein